MIMFIYNNLVKFFFFIGWNGALPETAAATDTAAIILFVINFTISLITGYNPFIHFVNWLEHVLAD